MESCQLALPSIAADVPTSGVISPRGLLDRAATLAEAADRTCEFAGWLRALANAGHQRDSPLRTTERATVCAARHRASLIGAARRACVARAKSQGTRVIAVAAHAANL